MWVLRWAHYVCCSDLWLLFWIHAWSIMHFISSCFVFWANVKGIEDVAFRVNVQPIKFDGYKNFFKFLKKIFLHKKCYLLVSRFVANNRMNLIVLNQNHLHANGHLNLPWFFNLCLIIYFCWQSNWIGSN